MKLPQSILGFLIFLIFLIPSFASADFTHNLKQGDSSKDVLLLQQFLNNHGFPVATKGLGSRGHESTYFGKATVIALKKYQKAYHKEILDPYRKKIPTGAFYSVTRAHVNKQLHITAKKIITTTQAVVPTQVPQQLTMIAPTSTPAAAPTSTPSYAQVVVPTFSPNQSIYGKGGGPGGGGGVYIRTDIAGLCGSSNLQPLSSIPSANLCAAGVASPVSGSGPWTWSCAGTNGAADASCAATTTPLNGSCGSSQNKSFALVPAANLCAAGNATAVGGSGPWTWSCTGVYGGTAASCTTSGADLDRTTGIRGLALSGVASPPLADQDYSDVAGYGANIARIGVNATMSSSSTFVLAQSEWDYMQTAVDMGKKYGFKVVITLSPIPDGQAAIYWDRPDLKANLVDIWTQIATRFNGNPVIAGYDLINEPVQLKDRDVPVGTTEYWRPLATSMITAIRVVDPNAVVIFEPSPWGNPIGFWPSGVPLVPLPFSRIVYSFHFYDPHEFTHQGLPGYLTPISYPTVYPYTKSYLSDVLQYVRLFKAAYPTKPIYVGEFSSVRTAPGTSTAAWLTDAIDLFDVEGFNWTYHAFRNWEGWDSEIGTGALYSPGPRSSTSSTITLLKNKGFNSNTLFSFPP